MSTLPTIRAADAVWRPPDKAAVRSPAADPAPRVPIMLYAVDRIWRLLQALIARRLEARVLAELEDLDDRMLSDIGLSRRQCRPGAQRCRARSIISHRPCD